MIWGRWEEPDRRVRALDPDGHTRRDWIARAPGDSDAELRKRLEVQGYDDISISPYDFQLWRERARRAASIDADAILARQKPPFQEAVWGALKRHLFDLSDSRCAYCEARVQHVDYGDVEHYRPKGRVDEDPEHDGYYWLAYEPNNLLPSCGLCNKASKRDRFPVRDGTRALDPTSQLEDEQPLLFNPYLDDPRTHLKFLATGDVDGKTEQGEWTIEICGLRRLRVERHKAMEQLANELKVRIMSYRDFKTAFTSVLEGVCEGGDEYCNALLDFLMHLIDAEQQRVQDEYRQVERLRQDAAARLEPDA